jgi:hypothetical protein
VGNAFSIIFAIIKAIPAVKSWWDQLVTFYVNKELENFKEADRAALRKAIHEQDQRDLEKQLGNPNAGEPSNAPGSVIVGELPNVVQRPKKK